MRKGSNKEIARKERDIQHLLTAKRCSKCLEIKDIAKFKFRKSTGRYESQCRPCEIKRDTNTPLKKQKRREAVDKYRFSDKGRETIRIKEAKRREDPLYRIKSNLSKRIKEHLICGYKSKRTLDIIGCTIEELKIHLENSFEANYGIPKEYIGSFKVHIDHITPLNSAKTEEEIYELNHYTNLQYLLAKDNIRKSDSLVWELI